MTDSIYAWSQTAASNANSDASINWAEFQNPDTVNDSARQMMARVAAYISDTAPKRSSTGTGNAYAVVSDAAGAALVNGMTICFIADRANTAAATLNVDGLGAKPFRPKVGTEFNANDILANQPVIAFYVSATQEWVAVNTGYHVSSTAAGLGLQAIVASLPKIGDMVLSVDATPAAGRIRLTESTQAVLKTSYPELNSWLSARSYPWGSTATHFNLPPAAGYFLRFAATSNAIDTAGARAAGAVQGDQNKSHTHSISGVSDTAPDHKHFVSSTTIGGATVLDATKQMSQQRSAGTSFDYQFGGDAAPATIGLSSASGSHSHAVSGTAEADGGDEVRVKNVAFHADIIASSADSAAQIAWFGFPYQWDTGTSAADPGAGRVRGNNATLASITALYFNAADRWGQNIGNLFTSLASDNRMHISRVGAGGNRLVFALTGTPTLVGGYYSVPVSVIVSSGATFANNDSLVMEYGVGAAGPAGSPGPAGSAGPNTGYDFAFDTGTADADPGAGKIRLNNAAPGSATFAYISKTDRNGNSLGTVIGAWGDSTNTAHRLTLRGWDIATPTKGWIGEVTGAFTDATTYWKIPLASCVALSGGAPSNAAVLAIMPHRTGNKGTDGLGTGDVTAASAFANDNRIIRSDGTSKGVQASGIAVDDGDNVSGVASLALTGDPASALHAATKQYVDNLAAGLDIKPSVKAATTANITLSGAQTIDGVSIGVGDLVLVKNQSAAAENGIYTCASGAWTRHERMDAWSEVPGSLVLVETGTANGDSGWICTSDVGGTLNTTAINWSRFFGSGLFQASSTLLTNIAALSMIADRMIYGTGTDTVALATLTAAGRAILDDADAAAQRTTLGVGTGDSPQFTAVNLGHASDTTLTRDSAGIMAVEGVPLYSQIPQNSQSAAYTLVLSDAQKHILHPTADNNARTFTIPANASVAYPIGTCLTFINEINTVTIAITSDTMKLAGAGTTGSRTLAANGMATAIKTGATTWWISGTGLT